MNMKLNVKENLNLLGAPDRQQSRIRRGLEDLLTTETNGRNENYVEAFPWRQAFVLEIESQVRVQTIQNYKTNGVREIHAFAAAKKTCVPTIACVLRKQTDELLSTAWQTGRLQMT